LRQKIAELEAANQRLQTPAALSRT